MRSSSIHQANGNDVSIIDKGMQEETDKIEADVEVNFFFLLFLITSQHH